MKKLLVFALLLLVAPAFAGIYGVVHDQISYSVAPEYFTKFKFHQFHLTDSPLPIRLRVAVVGWRASWWMGLPIGVLIGGVGLLERDAARMGKVCLQAMGVAIAVTLLVGLGGLIFGFFVTRAGINRADYSGWFVPADVLHLRNYLCAGYMHNASYLGGVASVVAAWIYQIWVRPKTP